MLPFRIRERDEECDDAEADGRDDAVELAELPNIDEHFEGGDEEQREAEHAEQPTLESEPYRREHRGVERPSDGDKRVPAVLNRAALGKGSIFFLPEFGLCPLAKLQIATCGIFFSRNLEAPFRDKQRFFGVGVYLYSYHEEREHIRHDKEHRRSMLAAFFIPFSHMPHEHISHEVGDDDCHYYDEESRIEDRSEGGEILYARVKGEEPYEADGVDAEPKEVHRVPPHHASRPDKESRFNKPCQRDPFAGELDGHCESEKDDGDAG